MLRGAQTGFKADSQITANRRGKIPCKQFVELVDGTQLLSADLPSLTNIPGLDSGPPGIDASINCWHLANRVIHLLLVRYFFHRGLGCDGRRGKPRLLLAKLGEDLRGPGSLATSYGWRGRVEEIEPGAQTHHGERMNLGDARLADAKGYPHFFHGEFFIVVKRQ